MTSPAAVYSMTFADRISRALADHHPHVVNGTPHPRAAVACVMRDNVAGATELLFIERAEREGDPWSGHLAFPGGRVDPNDASPQAAAEREAREEVALDLSQARLLGRLSDVVGAGFPIVVSPFIYAIDGDPPLKLQPDEVAAAFWTPYDQLLDPARQTTLPWVFRGRDLEFPAIDLLGPGRPPLWGLTYRLIYVLMDLVGHRLPALPRH